MDSKNLIMKWTFKLWSEIKPQAKINIDPKLGLRKWGQLNETEKRNSWWHFNLNQYFLLDKGDENGQLSNEDDFICTIEAVRHLNNTYKKMAFAKNYLSKQHPFDCLEDFERIFFHEKEDVVIEMLSAYAKTLFNLRKDQGILRTQNSEEDYQKDLLKWKLEPFEKFKNVFNDIFEQFELNYKLTKGGIIPYQPKIIIQHIYEPVLEGLCKSKFERVNRDIEDAIKQFHKKDKNAYSTCISLCIAAIEVFLRIAILDYSEKVDSQVLSKLINEAQRKEAIPNDFFSKQIFSNLESVFMKERKEKGQAHPKVEYATEKNAKLMLNLTMVFIQHCIENK